MRENRLSGSEGGGAEINRLSLPLWEKRRRPQSFDTPSIATKTRKTLLPAQIRSKYRLRSQSVTAELNAACSDRKKCA